MTQKPVFQEGILTLNNLRSMGAAAVVEVLLAFGLATLLIWQQVRTPIATKQPVVDPGIAFTQTPPQPQHNLPVPKQPEQTAPLREVQAVPTDVPTPTALPLQAPPPPFSERQSAPPAGLADEFGSKVLRAINAQKVYPRSQLVLGITGEAVISFDYVDGVVTNIRVDRSSGSHELDQAAMQAVQRAVLPPKPAELSGLDHFVFTLAFDLGR